MKTLRAQVTELLPALRERASAAENARQVPQETIDDLRAARLFRALVPKSFGGDELMPSEVLEAVIELARGWVTCKGTNVRRSMQRSRTTTHSSSIAARTPSTVCFVEAAERRSTRRARCNATGATSTR